MALWIIVAILAIVFWRQLYYVLAVPVCVCVALLPTVFAGLMVIDATQAYRLNWLHVTCIGYFGLSMLVIGYLLWAYLSVMFTRSEPPQRVQDSIKQMEVISGGKK